MKIQKSFKQEGSKLYLIPTPIGNLADITLRAIETLKSVDLIASEDTRNTGKLLKHFDISKKQVSFHEHNASEKIPFLIEFIKKGHSVAQVSDAGMPSISDPGQNLVAACIENDIAVIALPGASAGITALIASGLIPQPHIFYGFLPRKNGEQRRFLECKKAYPETQIFYESPFRVAKTLTLFLEIYGDRQLVLARELTKLYEEYRRGSISEVLKSLTDEPIKGECLLIVSGETDVATLETEGTYTEQVERLIETGMSSKMAIKQVAKLNNVEKQLVYSEFHNR
ncbi:MULTISPECIES: 16S rRNA (cytidine(1402)-2'-O)-methyltransferase [unclassified Enterococcus]|uniref:16S rRNA (cytidine(1402)-2'-O)-methyltransferase n=1 Tax=unclassified Enterococcus TaxID=2608891 RepID=UPI0015560797|nr:MULTISPECIES: 16S rRNA (cytidine(1402)-2'-O)-methyltransferase [unclassified Enterococcus]MBS7577883.1 16S rRNA (cytidine(1402)-2'-O)-methyltransferase [Enterococcus sp. MMGLQ5-2]MBS7585143.1 16S rRNA (cytidine(1402)-2'-O)-methyltransferase [Enterococcus sp. MMGLQ5-1]NPD12999.1 16S rRNA (cytidine(1402)-2'-O)-methyltransferase [Enterococcus sp. MMGLQ5-1]NPD37713.1 16S rRNA (cytidine(1402)-2'-O)-methyltransferase [Enterococcus sp. MMGLQ5-2]